MSTALDYTICYAVGLICEAKRGFKLNDTVEFVGDAFDAVSVTDGLCGWIDLLGTKSRKFSKERIEKFIDAAMLVSSDGHVDATGMFKAVSNAKTNVLLVGDAICISQKRPESFKYARDAVVLVTAFLSHNLFLQSYPHRGAIAKGSLEVGTRNGMRFATGEAVLNAIQLEGSVKTTGIVIAENLLQESETWQVPKTEAKFRFIDAFGYRYLTFDLHRASWRTFCQKHIADHPYIAASATFI